VTRSSLLAAAGGLALASPAAAQDRARTTIQPYVEANQLLAADLKGGDAVTYTTLAAGVDASIDTNRTSAQLSYRYERYFDWDDDLGDQDVHSGLARISARLTPGLAIESGAIATRARSDIRGAAPGVLVGNVANVSQVYSVYAGPSLSTTTGPLAVDAYYRVGYTKVETPTFDGLAPGQPRLDYYDDAINHQAFASIGTGTRGGQPVGVTVSGAWEREDAGQLSQRYDGWFARGDLLVPISPYFAFTAGVGYEKIETSQRDALVAANGAPVLDEDGRFVEDPASPRRVSYRTDGVYYDAGVVWRPNRRTELQARVGERYGSLSYTGSLTYQASQNVGLAIGVYDSVQTFGRQLRNGLTGLPTSFVAARDANFGQQYSGCVFGTSGAAPGGCLSDVFQSISTASYRARGIDGVLSATRGRHSYGVGAGYANREIHRSGSVPGVTVYGLNDESWYGQVFWQYALSPNSGVDANGFFNYFSSELPGSEDVVSLGATGTYFRNFGRLGTTASVGLYTFKVGDFESELSAQALLGARYTF
jgi:hypothetical protein